jgi:hypothetical protein
MGLMIVGFVAMLTFSMLCVVTAWKWMESRADLKALDARQKWLQEAENEAAWRRNRQMHMR